MANLAIPTIQANWMPTNQSEHEADSNSYIDPVSNKVIHTGSVPSITHGNNTAWSSYSRLDYSRIQGKGPFEKDWSNGSIYTTWGSSGSKHSEIFHLGSDDESRWMPYVKGVGFKVFRHRTDSTSFTNDNANQHCIYVERYGMRFKHRSSSSQRFWSSAKLATSGEAKVPTFGYQGGVACHEFYQASPWGSDNYRDYLLTDFWVNLASRDTSKVGTATTKVYIYDLRFYYESQGSNQRLAYPAFRLYDERNKAMVSS